MTIQSLRQKHTDRTRQSIIDAAFELFLEHGFAATTVDDIAMQADIAPRTFFRYFPTKESVLFHDTDAKLNSIRDRLSERPAGESASEAIVGLLAGMAEDLSNDQKRCELIVRLSAEDDSFLAARHRAMMDQATTAIVTAVSERTGVPASDVGLQAMTAAVVACASTAIHCWFNEGAPGDPRAYLERAVASCREAFSASPPLRAP